MFTTKTFILMLVALSAVAQNESVNSTPDCVIPLKCDFSNPTKRELKTIRLLKDTEVIFVRKNNDDAVDSLRGRFVVMSDNSVGFAKSKPSKEGWDIIVFSERNGPDDYILLRALCVDLMAVK